MECKRGRGRRSRSSGGCFCCLLGLLLCCRLFSSTANHSHAHTSGRPLFDRQPLTKQRHLKVSTLVFQTRSTFSVHPKSSRPADRHHSYPPGIIRSNPLLTTPSLGQPRLEIWTFVAEHELAEIWLANSYHEGPSQQCPQREGTPRPHISRTRPIRSLQCLLWRKPQP